MSDSSAIQAASDDPRSRREARQAAVVLEILQDAVSAVADGQPADATLAAAYRRRRELGSRDRRLISRVVFSFFRWRGWLATEPLPRAAALAAALDGTEPDPVLDRLAGETVPAWGSLTLDGKRAALATHRPGVPGLDDLMPDGFAAGLPAEADHDRLIASLQERPPAWLRVRQGRRDQALALLHRAGCRVIPDERLSDALCCPDGIVREALDRVTGRLGEIQDVASQAVGLICAPKSGDRWWDVCAGSGGKTLHLADLVQDRGEIVSGDVRPAILEELEARVRRANFRCVRPLKPGRKAEGLFDGVLVDAPCSGHGTWSRNPDMRWRTPATLPDELHGVQVQLLDEAAVTVRRGGRLVYAVCTFTRRETLDVLADFAARHPDFQPEPFDDPFGGPATLARQYWPWEGPGDGMFVARWKRSGSDLCI